MIIKTEIPVDDRTALIQIETRIGQFLIAKDEQIEKAYERNDINDLHEIYRLVAEKEGLKLALGIVISAIEGAPF